MRRKINIWWQFHTSANRFLSVIFRKSLKVTEHIGSKRFIASCSSARETVHCVPQTTWQSSFSCHTSSKTVKYLETKPKRSGVRALFLTIRYAIPFQTHKTRCKLRWDPQNGNHKPEFHRVNEARSEFACTNVFWSISSKAKASLQPPVPGGSLRSVPNCCSWRWVWSAECVQNDLMRALAWHWV